MASRPSPNSAEAKLDPDKKWVWVEDKEEGYIAGYIISEKGDQIQVNLTTDKVSYNFLEIFVQKINPN